MAKERNLKFIKSGVSYSLKVCLKSHISICPTLLISGYLRPQNHAMNAANSVAVADVGLNRSSFAAHSTLS